MAKTPVRLTLTLGSQKLAPVHTALLTYVIFYICTMNFPFISLTVRRNGRFCLLFLLLLLGSAYNAFSQKGIEKNGTTFRIQKAGNTYTSETVIQTLENADLRFHRFRAKSNVLVLDDFTEIEILSAETLSANGVAVEVSQYREAYPAMYETPVFRINKYILLEQRTTRTPDK